LKKYFNFCGQSYLHLSHAMVILIRLDAVAGPDEISSVGSAVEVARVRLEDGWLLLLASLPVSPG
jgi:hypothetical protein